MKNKEHKREILNENKRAVAEYGHQRYEYQKKGVMANTLTHEDFGLDELDFTCLEQMRKAKNMQRKRINEHTGYWLNKGWFIDFATFTFNNDAMELTPRTRRRLIAQTLAQCTDLIPDYIGNIDYGDTTDREHYHLMLALLTQRTNVPILEHHGQVDIPRLRELWAPYGFICIKPMAMGTEESVCGYIAKLNSHSLKVHQSKLLVPKLSEYHEHKRYQNELKKAIRNTQKKTRHISSAVLIDTYNRAMKNAQKDLPF